MLSFARVRPGLALPPVRAAERERWVRRNAYYHASVAAFVRRVIPPGARVLQVGSDLGQVLGAIDRPARALGVDPNPDYVAAAAARWPGVEFRVGDPHLVACGDEAFDYVVLTDVLGSIQDVQQVLDNAYACLAPGGRVLITYYNYVWEPLLKLAEWLGQKMPQSSQNWLPLAALDTLLETADFEVVQHGHFLLLPRHVPLLSALLNRFVAPVPIIRRLGLVQYVIARPSPRPVPASDLTCSVVVPCRNEAGTIAELVERLPAMGRHTEIIFVEGHSRDGTLEACRRVQAAHPERDITVLVQGGRGKGDAVRQGFAAARGDVLMILDADLAVPPEDLPRFFRALATYKGDLINGTRLIYPMERQAMRFLNLLGNRFFSVLFSYLVGQRLTDTLCGTKALSREAYARIAANRAYFGDFDPFGDFDLLLGAARLNLKITEIPVRYRSRTYGATNISRFRHGVLLLRMSWLAMRKLKFAA